MTRGQAQLHYYAYGCLPGPGPGPGPAPGAPPYPYPEEGYWGWCCGW